jgi:transcriptional regulator with XRE-family HTH domain
MVIGDRLKEIRELRGMSHCDIEKHMGLLRSLELVRRHIRRALRPEGVSGTTRFVSYRPAL